MVLFKKSASKLARPQLPEIVPTSYTSKPIEIPDDFLTTIPHDGQPITVAYIDFTKTEVPEYDGCYAVVLDNVLSHSECEEFLRLAEASAGAGDEGVVNDGWKPAMVNAGPGKEFMMTEYRNSDRIIWDQPEVMQRLWDRCQQAPGGLHELQTIENNPALQGVRAVAWGDRWKVTTLNERMRFLKYGSGQYFRRHCDGPYGDLQNRSFYTLHLYLNNSTQAREISKDAANSAQGVRGVCSGGATTFHSSHKETCQLDVHPIEGRVLIFQHKDLLHSGADVTSGTKYTLRTDLMFQRLPDEDGEADEGPPA
ncbi:MAG: 3-keto-steroid reductase [Chaenotheca gracillima]|nr:MAG: 3-keto-steroid reductase [Chaenotheca gracillima]